MKKKMSKICRNLIFWNFMLLFINLTTSYGIAETGVNDALLNGSRQGNLQKVIDALEKDADINTKDKYKLGDTALMHACAKWTHRNCKDFTRKRCRCKHAE